MSDSETAAAPAEAPVPAACASIKADLDKWREDGARSSPDLSTVQLDPDLLTSPPASRSVAEKGAESCKDLMEAFTACVKSAAEGTS